MKLRTAVVQWLASLDSAQTSDLSCVCAAKSQLFTEVEAQLKEEILSGRRMASVLVYHQQFRARYSKSVREAPSAMSQFVHAADHKVGRGNRKASQELWQGCLKLMAYCYGIEVSDRSKQLVLKADHHTIATLFFTVYSKLRKLRPRRKTSPRNSKPKQLLKSASSAEPEMTASRQISSSASAPQLRPSRDLRTLSLEEQIQAIQEQGDVSTLEEKQSSIGGILLKCTMIAFDAPLDDAAQLLTSAAFTERFLTGDATTQACAEKWCLLLFERARSASSAILTMHPALHRLTIHRVLTLLSPPLCSPCAKVVSGIGGVLARVCYDLAMAGFHEDLWHWFMGTRNTGFQALAGVCRRHGYRVVMDLFPLLDIVCRRYFGLLFGVHLQSSLSSAIRPQDILLLCAFVLPLIAASPAACQCFVHSGALQQVLATVRWYQERMRSGLDGPRSGQREIQRALNELLAALVLHFEHADGIGEDVVLLLKSGMKSAVVEEQVCACCILFTLCCTRQTHALRCLVYKCMVFEYFHQSHGSEIMEDCLRDNIIAAHAAVSDLPVQALVQPLVEHLQVVRPCNRDFCLLLSCLEHPQFDIRQASKLLPWLFQRVIHDEVFSHAATYCIAQCVRRFYFKVELGGAVDSSLRDAMKSGFEHGANPRFDWLISTLLSLPFKGFTDRVRCLVLSFSPSVGTPHRNPGNGHEKKSLQSRPLGKRLQPLKGSSKELKKDTEKGEEFGKLLRPWNSALFKVFLLFAQMEVPDDYQATDRTQTAMQMTLPRFNRFCIRTKLQPAVVSRQATLELFNRDRATSGSSQFLHFVKCLCRILSVDAFDSFTGNKEGSLGRVLQLMALIYHALLSLRVPSNRRSEGIQTTMRELAAKDKAFLVDVALERPGDAAPLLAIQRRLDGRIKRLFLRSSSNHPKRDSQRHQVVTGAVRHRGAIEAALEVIDAALVESVSEPFLLRCGSVQALRNQNDLLAMPKRRQPKMAQVKRAAEAAKVETVLAADVARLRRQQVLERKLLQFQKEKRVEREKQMRMDEAAMELKLRQRFAQKKRQIDIKLRLKLREMNNQSTQSKGKDKRTSAAPSSERQKSRTNKVPLPIPGPALPEADNKANSKSRDVLVKQLAERNFQSILATAMRNVAKNSRKTSG